jgi:hypothetical protein
MYPGMAKDAREARASTTSPSGSRRSPRPRSRTRAASQKALEASTSEVVVRSTSSDGSRAPTFRGCSALAPLSFARHWRGEPHERDPPDPGEAAGDAPARRALPRAARSGGGAAARVPDLPRVPDVRELLRVVPGDVPPHRRASTRARPRGPRRSCAADIHAVADQCWQCKLCYIKCPYTPDEGASELLDFPRLMARERAVRAQRRASRWSTRILGEPQRIGALGSGVMAPLANFVHASQLVRKVQEKVTGISAQFKLPPMARETFTPGWRKHKPLAGAGERGRGRALRTPATASTTRPRSPSRGGAGARAQRLPVRYPGSGQTPTQARRAPARPAAGCRTSTAATSRRRAEKVEHNVALLLPARARGPEDRRPRGRRAG